MFAVAFIVLVTADWFGDAALSKTGQDEKRPAKKGKEADPVIEEVSAKQLERLLNDKDFVAVYWCKLLTAPPHPEVVDYFERENE